MVNLYTVTAEINVVQKSGEIIAKPEPNYFQLKNSVDTALKLGNRDVLNEKTIKFTLLKSNLGL